MFCCLIEFFRYRPIIKFDRIEINQHIQIPSRVLNHLTCAGKNEIIGYKYKYDGYTGRLVILDKNMAHYSDKKYQYASIKNLPAEIGKYQHLILQLEVFDTMLIVTDVIGAYISGIGKGRSVDLYSVAPVEVLKFLDKFKDKTYEIRIDDKPKTLHFQRLLTTGMYINFLFFILVCSHTRACVFLFTFLFKGTEKPLAPYDGFIAYGEQREYKYKAPTCDVKLKDGCLYLDGNNQIFGRFKTTQHPNGIYEIYLENNEPVILRRRDDRKHAATPIQFETFLKTSENWVQCINSIIIGHK